MCRLPSRGELFHGMVGLSSDHFHSAESKHHWVRVQLLPQFVPSEKTGCQPRTSGRCLSYICRASSTLGGRKRRGDTQRLQANFKTAIKCRGDDFNHRG